MNYGLMVRDSLLNFVDCESDLESNSPDIRALWDTNLDGSSDSGNFFVKGCLPLIRKDSSTHTYGLTVYVKEGLPFAQNLSLENSADSYFCFWPSLLHSLSCFFFLFRSPSLSLYTAFDSVLSNIGKVLSINPSTNVFVFGDFNLHHRDWLTYSGGTDRSDELRFNFSISNGLTQTVNFPTGSLTVILTVLLFWIYLFLLTLVFVLQWLSLHWEILIMFLSQFSLTFHHIYKGMPLFIA